jgi:hypothetical protein
MDKQQSAFVISLIVIENISTYSKFESSRITKSLLNLKLYIKTATQLT